MVFSKYILKFLFSFCVICLAALSGAGAAYAADPIDKACDPVFMERMKERAWMEAQREIMIAQSVIAKPDSVFALGCFGKWWSVFQSKDVVAYGKGPSGEIRDFVKEYLKAPSDGSFGHNFGGGHSALAQTDTDCTVMSQLWNHAQCANLTNAQMITLSDLVGGAEPRIFPKACAGAEPKTTYGKARDNLIVVGLQGVKFDAMNLFIPITAPLTQTDPKTPKCSAGIPTGITVNTKNEIICPNPGCSPTTEGKCCKSGAPPAGQCSS